MDGKAGAELSVSPAFFLLGTALYYIGGGAAITAFFTAALAHELGHLTAIYMMGGELKKICFTATGPVIEYGGVFTPLQELGIALAGPGSGLLLAGGCFLAGTPFFRYSGAIAVLSSLFNLMPVMPMDGGRIGLYLLETAMDKPSAECVIRVIGTVCAAAVAVTGIVIRSFAAAAAGFWMGVLANRPDLR